MSTRFEICLAETLKWEGGWSDHPKDPGGATMRGITIGVFAAFCGVQVPKAGRELDLLKQRLRAISPETVKTIYRRNYWDPLRCDDLPPGIDGMVFDYGVNSGISRSAKGLQMCLGVTIDGHVGERSIAAAKRADGLKLVEAFMAERRRFIRQIRTYPTFGRGWERRCDGIENAALAGLGEYEARGPDVWPLADADEQSATQGRATPTVRPQDQMSGEEKGAIGAAAGAAALAGQSIKGELQGQIATGKGVTMLDIALAALGSPLVWIAAFTVATTVFALVNRRNTRKTQGV